MRPMREIVVAMRGRVGRVASQLARRRFKRIQAIAERYERM